MIFNQRLFMLFCLGLCLCLFSASNAAAIEQQLSKTLQTQQAPSSLRIVALSPHLTELTFALGLGEYLVGVSDFSDYPQQALDLPRIASYQGANIPNILRLKPSHILAWKGGNKDVDIAKLQDAGIPVYLSSIQNSDTLLQDIQNIAHFLGEAERANDLLQRLEQRIKALQLNHENRHQRYFYYLSSNPIMALGNDPWLNDLLALCGLNNVFADSIAPYPQLNKAQILRKAPQIIISAENTNSSTQTLQSEWHSDALAAQAKLLRADPDKLHRFTPRAIDELETICQQAYANH